MTSTPHDVEVTPIALSLTGSAEAEHASRCVRSLRAQLRLLDAGLRVHPLGTRFVEGAIGRGGVDVVVSAASPLLELCTRRLALEGKPLLEGSELSAHGGMSLADGAAITLRLVVTGSAAEQALLGQQAALSEPALRERYAVALQHAASGGASVYHATKRAFWATWESPGPSWRAVREPVLKVLTAPEWQALCERHETSGAPIDERDGYVHLSTPTQVHETVARHFQGQSSLWLLTLDATALGPALRYEPSRGGALFPHLYAPLRLRDVALARPYVGPTASSLGG